MSAFLVSDDHITAICCFADKCRGAGFPQHGKLFQVLKQANLNALTDRYGDPAERAEEKVGRLDLGLVEILKAAQCLEYQCCDWDQWDGSEAEKYLRWIKSAAIGRLPGYAEAHWEVPSGAARYGRQQMVL